MTALHPAREDLICVVTEYKPLLLESTPTQSHHNETPGTQARYGRRVFARHRPHSPAQVLGGPCTFSGKRGKTRLPLSIPKRRARQRGPSLGLGLRMDKIQARDRELTHVRRWVSETRGIPPCVSIFDRHKIGSKGQLLLQSFFKSCNAGISQRTKGICRTEDDQTVPKFA